jgi:hypothetical protein
MSVPQALTGYHKSKHKEIINIAIQCTMVRKSGFLRNTEGPRTWKLLRMPQNKINLSYDSRDCTHMLIR